MKEKIREGYKLTEVGVIPEDWEVKRLGEIAEINPKNSELQDEFIYIDLESVETGKLKFKNKISKRSAPSRAKRTLKIGDILFQTVRPYQKNNFYFDLENENYVASTGYAQIRGSHSLKFLYQYLHTNKFIEQVLNLCTGTSYPAINSTDLKEVFVLNPPLEEQEKIAEILTTWDEAIEKLENIIEAEKEYKKGMMQKIFSQEIRFKDDNGNDYPSWEDKKLRDIGVFYNGLSGKTKEDFGNGHPYITYKSIFDSNKIDLGKVDYVRIEKDEEQNKVEIGDIFFTTSSETIEEVGMSSVLLESIESCYLNSFCFGFRLTIPKENLSNFFRFYLRDASLRKKISNLGQGSTRYNISKIQLSKLFISVPTFEEQEKIANFLTIFDDKIEVLEKKLYNIMEQKKGLMQKLLTGEIRVKI